MRLVRQLLFSLLCVTLPQLSLSEWTYVKPPWWNYIKQTVSDVKACRGRQFPPNPGSSCGNSRSCFWGEQTCTDVGTYPQIKCTCDGDNWSCIGSEAAPIDCPMLDPSSSPSLADSQIPSLAPTSKDSLTPSHFPSLVPSHVPSFAPTLQGSQAPSLIPSSEPSQVLSFAPPPSLKESLDPLSVPSLEPTQTLSLGPSSGPTSGWTYAEPEWWDIIQQRYGRLLDTCDTLVRDSTAQVR